MGAADAEALDQALTAYRIVAVVDIIIGIGMLVCGGLGTTFQTETDIGLPYYLGGFLIGSTMLASGVLCAVIGVKGAENKSGVKSREAACCVMIQYILSMVVLMMCFMGVIFSGIPSCDGYGNVSCPSEVDAIRYSIIAGGCIAIVSTIVGMCFVCKYGKLFGVVMKRGQRGRSVLTIDTSVGPSQTANTSSFGALGTNTFLANAGNGSRVQQLERENELLQKQLQLQGQLNQQRQQPQQYGGVYPPASAIYGDAAYPPPSAFP